MNKKQDVVYYKTQLKKIFKDAQDNNIMININKNNKEYSIVFKNDINESTEVKVPMISLLDKLKVIIDELKQREDFVKAYITDGYDSDYSIKVIIKDSSYKPRMEYIHIFNSYTDYNSIQSFENIIYGEDELEEVEENMKCETIYYQLKNLK